jgi:hypothetical protein
VGQFSIGADTYIDMHQPVSPHTMTGQRFLDDLVAEVKAGEQKFEPRRIKAYLDALGNATASESGTTGFIVMVDRKGTVRELPIDDFRELRLQIGAIREHKQKMQVVIEQLEAKAFEATLAAADAKRARKRTGLER